MDKFKETGRNLGRVFNFKCVRVRLCLAVALRTKTAQLKVENSARTTFRFSPVGFCAPRICSNNGESFLCRYFDFHLPKF